VLIKFNSPLHNNNHCPSCWFITTYKGYDIYAHKFDTGVEGYFLYNEKGTSGSSDTLLQAKRMVDDNKV
jgi:hypothetical protein